MPDKTTFRAVFDTNVIIAALKSKNPSSPTIELLQRWRNGEFTLLYADDLLLEYREKLVARQIEPALRVRFLASLDALGEQIQLSSQQIVAIIADDPDDDIVLACAVVGQATHLVTYDPHLLNLGETYQGIIILDGLHFLYAVRGDQRSGLPSSEGE
ncbi:MAG TPA: putative toxin-antitoxin system toxin component, PIN family [Chloroflexota bacterium]|nr:putative toxin-antitoxin system toxin component, PIN family [Chloroflexota bacterium]HUM71830.1 putative toxin-antitoxin system toxin component, PIN family [Chloroflexota bacterium]